MQNRSVHEVPRSLPWLTVIALGLAGALGARLLPGALQQVSRVLQEFISVCLSSWRIMALGSPLALLWSFVSLGLAGWLKQDRHLRTGYTRKVFHLCTFSAVGVAHVAGGLAMVCVVGGTTTLVLAYAILRGAGHPFYEALARESDGQHGAYFIGVSYLATLLGGVLSNLIAGDAALVGYLVCGLGDAAGEPVGTRWGRHWYSLSILPRAQPARRSLEGSAGVLVGSILAVAIGVAILDGQCLPFGRWRALIVVAFVSTLAEAASPRGWDNATMQLIPSLLVSGLLGR